MSLIQNVSRLVRVILSLRIHQLLVVVFTSAFIFMFPSGAVAEDILDIYEFALKNDRVLSAAKNQFEVVKQGEIQVKGLYYPTLDLSYEYTDTDQTINRSDNEVFGTGESQFPTNVLNLSLTQPLFRWDFRNDRKRAKAEVVKGELELFAAEQELMLRAAEAYLLLLASQDTAVMAQAELDAVGEQLKLSEKRFEIGLANAGEVSESRARFLLNQAELIQAGDVVIDRQEALRVITGGAVGDLAQLKDTFPMVSPEPADIDSWSGQAANGNLALQSRIASVAVAEAEYNRQKSDRYPDIDLFANFNNRDAQGSLFGGGSDVDTSDIGVRAQWTLYQGGRLSSKIREAKFKMAQAEDELEVEKASVRRETRSAYLGVVSGIARAIALKSSVDAQEMSLRAKEKGFDNGANSNLEVLDAKRDFFFVKRDFLKARYDYLLSMLNLKRMVGSLTPADLGQINGLLVGRSSVMVGSSQAFFAEDFPLIEDISGGASKLDAGLPVEVQRRIELIEDEVIVETAVRDDLAEVQEIMVIEESMAVEKVDVADEIQVDEQAVVAGPVSIIDAQVEAAPVEQVESIVTVDVLSQSVSIDNLDADEALPLAQKTNADVWLSSLKDDTFTLRLASSPSLKQCEELSYKANETVYCFESIELDGTWFALAGDFETRDSAQSAAQKIGFKNAFPRSVGRLKRTRCLKPEIKTAFPSMCGIQNLNSEEGFDDDPLPSLGAGG